MNNYYFGIDVGGMSIKGGVVNSSGEVIYKKVSLVKKPILLSLDEVVFDLKVYALKNNISFEKIGMGVPCIFNNSTGKVSYGNNLNFNNVNLRKYFIEKYNLVLKLANDADAATVGEYYFGAGRGYDNIALITIGTGIGGGFIHKGILLENESSCFGEIGHSVIKLGGRKCVCGRKGCMEAYCSMPALYGQIRRAMLKNKQSLLWKKVNIEDIKGEAFFACVEDDDTAKNVYKKYIQYLGAGVVNIANIFRPDVILIGGGVSAQKDKLVKPIDNYLRKYLFAKEHTRQIEVKAAENGNDAGIIGAASLLINSK